MELQWKNLLSTKRERQSESTYATIASILKYPWASDKRPEKKDGSVPYNERGLLFLPRGIGIGTGRRQSSSDTSGYFC